MSADVSIAAALFAGLLSFLSPCVLPLVPPYLVYLAGTSLERFADAEPEPLVRRETVLAALLFVAGFSTVFIAFGASASAVGALVRAYSHALAIIAGIVIIVMGLHFLGLTRLAVLMRERRPRMTKPVGLWGAYVMGLCFAFGWTPCIGPILAAILAVAASKETVTTGAGLLAVYSAGLGIPFLIAAFAIEPFAAFLARFKRHLAAVEKVMGGLLVLMFVDMVEFVRRIERGIYDPKEFAKALKWVRQNCHEGRDPNDPKKQHTREQKDKEWEYCVKMAMIARDLMVGNPKLTELGFGEEGLGNNSILAGFQGQRQWTDHLPNGDFLEAILNTSFDWSGIRQPYVVATENDSLNGACMLFSHLLTGSAQIFADVRTYWSPDAVKRVTGHTLEGKAAAGILHLINSGPAALDGTGQQEINGVPAIKPWWQVTPEDAAKCLDNTEWCNAVLEYFCGAGYSTRYKTRGGMPVTMTRLNIIKGIGPALQIAEGETVELPDDVHDALDKRTNETWPTTWFVPNCSGSGEFRDPYTVMNNWGANHGAFSYGHIGADIITLASMLRIPVYMHNVCETKIFRPSVWTAFGCDTRACTTLGPVYGKY